ncbi:MAG TPA: hypothetical protein VGZ29_05580 [Terriglobia bacterium]|nr:hypothetical protein [Terriglobia bacterium]
MRTSRPSRSEEEGDRQVRAARYFNTASLALKILYEAAAAGNDVAIEVLRHFAGELNDRAAGSSAARKGQNG